MSDYVFRKVTLLGNQPTISEIFDHVRPSQQDFIQPNEIRNFIQTNEIRNVFCLAAYCDRLQMFCPGMGKNLQIERGGNVPPGEY